MKKTPFSHATAFLFCLLIPAAVNGAELADVLGTVTDWKVSPAGYVVAGQPGQVTLAGPSGQTLTLEHATSQTTPFECQLSYRLKPPTGTSCYVLTQVTSAGKTASFSVSAGSGNAYLSYGASTQGFATPPKPVAGVQYLQAVTDRSLAWSEEMRKTIEAQIAAAPKIEETVLNLRFTVEAGRCRGWLNGRYVGEVALDATPMFPGTVTIQASPGAEVVSARVRPLAAVPGRFEPISIDGHLNSATLGGAKLDRGSFPDGGSQDKPATVNGVPFRFSNPSAKGGDHIDVGVSWTRFGAIPGYIAGNFGLFGGRWISADRIDPSRISMYVPKGRYKALHLIAIADGRKDSVPVVSAQFYRPGAGHPFNFSTTVPTIKGDAGNAHTVPVKLVGGKSARLYHVSIPLDPDSFSWFTDLDRIALEITKQVHYYRAYPDPLEFSWHGGGLPSSVQIYAMTLERVGVDADLQPDQFGHVWTAPAAPSYTVALRNETGAATTAKVSVATRSHDGKDTTKQEQSVSLPADGSPVKVPLALKPTRYGLHELVVTVTAGKESATYRRNFAHLHPNTREQAHWEHGHGSIFGYWGWNGGHDTPKSDKEITVMAAAGAETSTANYQLAAPEIRALAEKHRFISEAAFFGGVMYYNGFYSWYSGAPKFDPADAEGSGQRLIEAMIKGGKAEPSAISRPTFVPFFAEPQIGNITTGVWPTHYGEEYTLTEVEQKAFEDMKAKFLAGARAIRKQWPDLKLLLPYGDPMNAAVFLRLAPESRNLIDGTALDLPGFERLPEQQINQVVLNRLYPILKDIREHVPNPYMVMIEGPCVSSKDIDTGQAEQADIGVRNFLLLMGYGVNIFESANGPFECANYWGENHYGGGWLTRLPIAMPQLSYVHYATITRNLNRANHTKYIPTGSTSAFCQQFKHYKTGKLIHVLWTIRGKRPVTLSVPAGATLELHDPNDNVTVLKEQNGVVTFTIDQSPQYLHGLTADAAVTLGESDHSDSQPAPERTKIANLGDGSWKLVAKEDVEYTSNKPLQIVRFLGKMNTKVVEAPAPQGKKALAVHLEKQDKDRGVMPFYTTLEPKRPITIPGKASHLGLWVHAASDWGRVVYSLRDANGEKWISVGTKEDWNNDDIHGWSAFCFDGWRYVRFQVPSNLPYDSYREKGSSWWGSYGGDGVVDLPLQLEKIIVERRPKVVYGADLVPAKPDDVLLGDLNAEYAQASDKGNEIVRLSKLRMPVPKDAPGLSNPIAEIAKTGVGAPTKVQRVVDPTYQYDGTRCHVHFEPVAGAKTYDVWVAPYADGRGALALGKGWTESGKLLEGLRPDIEFYLFVVYTDKDGKPSKPSEPFKFTLKNRFGYK